MVPILVMKMSAAADMVAPSLPGAGLLNSKVLVLNCSYLPVHVTSVKRAFALLYQGVAKAVDEQYHTFDFDSCAICRLKSSMSGWASWTALSASRACSC